MWSWNVYSSIVTLRFEFLSEIDQIDRYEMQEYIKISVRNSSYQSKTSAHALSAVLECPIRLLWPQVEFLDMPKNSYVAIGRGVENRLNPTATLMFTSTSFNGAHFNFNHWVPLVQMQEVCFMTLQGWTSEILGACTYNMPPRYPFKCLVPAWWSLIVVAVLIYM